MKTLKALYSKPILRISVSAVLFLAGIITEQLYIPEVYIPIYVLALITAGLPVFTSAVKGILRRDFLDEKFLMTVASVGAMTVGEWSEGVAVMLFFLVGETFEQLAVRRSRNSIRSLMDIMPDEATLITEGKEERVDADEVEVGSTVIIRPGERVPLDCRIVSGSSDIDTSAMTGESLPRSVGVGDELDSGVIVLDGILTAVTLRISEESAASRILELVENASENKAKEESFITAFSRYYTPAVVGIALLVAILPPIFGWLTLADSVYRALIMLVISCPCALVISVPMAFFGGIGGGASQGILCKGGNIFSTLASAGTFAFDKTGTLTSGSFGVASVRAIGVSENELLMLAASAEYGSNHPIAAAIKAASSESVKPDSVREIAGEGVIASVNGSEIAVGNEKLMRSVGASTTEGQSGILVAQNGVFIGEITVRDSIKAEAQEAIGSLKALGASQTVMISGDKRENAERVAAEIGLDMVYSEMTPEQKFNKLEQLIRNSRRPVVYVGDGINDSPSLARADVGIAMGKMGQDSAIESSDVVITTDDLRKLPRAVLLARKTMRIVKFNIVFAIGIKLLVLLLGALNLANMWFAVFADVGVAVIAILNSMRALRVPDVTKQ